MGTRFLEERVTSLAGFSLNTGSSFILLVLFIGFVSSILNIGISDRSSTMYCSHSITAARSVKVLSLSNQEMESMMQYTVVSAGN